MNTSKNPNLILMLECMFVGYFRITEEKKLFWKSSMALECIRLSSVTAHIVHKKVCTKDCAQKMFRLCTKNVQIVNKKCSDCAEKMFRLCRKNVQIVENKVSCEREKVQHVQCKVVQC